MKKDRSSRMASATLVMLGAAVFAVSVEAGSPPSRQTPYIVPKDKQGVVEVGPCQMPPCVGGKTCVPNARDYGYYEGTWRQWPTQQRYDQRFPQAVGGSPLAPQSGTTPTAVTAPSTSSGIPAPVPVDTIVVPDEPEPTPLMGNFEAPGITVSPTTVVPQTPVQPADPLLDYSSNTVPGISTAPSVPTPPALDAVPAAPVAPPALDVPSLDPVPAPAASPSPILEDDSDAELTAPAPGQDSPILETEPAGQTNTDDALSVPMTQQAPQGEHSIIVSQNGSGLAPLPQPEDPYIPLEDAPVVNPYDQAAMQVSHEEPASDSTAVNPFQTAAIPSDVSDVAVSEVVSDSASETTVGDAIQDTTASPFDALSTETSGNMESIEGTESTENAENTETQPGLEGFCPVTLLETEEWVEGNSQWSVIHHGVTYYLSSAAQVQKFLANPGAYTPVLDGCDPVLFAETGEKKVGTADNCVVYEGKLFMFATEANLNKFFTNTSAYMK